MAISNFHLAYSPVTIITINIRLFVGIENSTSQTQPTNNLIHELHTFTNQRTKDFIAFSVSFVMDASCERP